MVLSQFLKSLSRDALDEFAKRCETSSAHLKQVAGSHRRAGEYLCINIERESGGVIRCESLRPDVDWAYLRSTAISEKAA